MYGIVTRNPDELDWETFDRGVYEAKTAAGEMRDPATEGTNLLSCFADESAARGDPGLLAETETGATASSDGEAFEFGYVCPSRAAYRRGLLETIEDCAGASPDVRLDEVGFPATQYCHCSVCAERFSEAATESRDDWRASVVTAFVDSAAGRVPGRLSLSVHPDPYPGHLRDRSGIDLEAVGGVVDEVVVPLYDPSYATTYWLSAIASGFADRLGGLEAEVELGVELFAVDASVDALLEATAAVEPFADTVYFGYDSSTARAALRRKRAQEQAGVSHG